MTPSMLTVLPFCVHDPGPSIVVPSAAPSGRGRLALVMSCAKEALATNKDLFVLFAFVPSVDLTGTSSTYTKTSPGN